MSATAYITAADIETFFSVEERTRLTNAGATEATYALVIETVNAEIAGYVGIRPLTFVPAAFKQHGCAMARFYLFKDKVSDRIQDAYSEAIKFFDKVASGKWQLPAFDDPATPEDETSLGAGIWFTVQPPRFSGRAY